MSPPLSGGSLAVPTGLTECLPSPVIGLQLCKSGGNCDACLAESPTALRSELIQQSEFARSQMRAGSWPVTAVARETVRYPCSFGMHSQLKDVLTPLTNTAFLQLDTDLLD
jgi:hypothetical protein